MYLWQKIKIPGNAGNPGNGHTPEKNNALIFMVNVVPTRFNQTFGTIWLPRVIMSILRQTQFSSPAPLKWKSFQWDSNFHLRTIATVI